MKLRKWVKVVLVVLVLVSVAWLGNNIEESAIDSCMENGNSYYFCAEALK